MIIKREYKEDICQMLTVLYTINVLQDDDIWSILYCGNNIADISVRVKGKEDDDLSNKNKS